MLFGCFVFVLLWLQNRYFVQRIERVQQVPYELENYAVSTASLSGAGSKTQTPQANRRSATIVGAPFRDDPFARSIM